MPKDFADEDEAFLNSLEPIDSDDVNGSIQLGDHDDITEEVERAWIEDGEHEL